MMSLRLSRRMRHRVVTVVAAAALAATTALAGCSSDSTDAGGDPGSAAGQAGSAASAAGQAGSAGSDPNQGAASDPGEAGSAGSSADPADGADQPEDACEALLGVNMGLVVIMTKPDLTEADVAAVFDPVKPFLAEIPEEIQQPLATLRSLGMEIAGGSTVAEVIEDGTEWGTAQSAFSQQMLVHCVGYAGADSGAAEGAAGPAAKDQSAEGAASSSPGDGESLLGLDPADAIDVSGVEPIDASVRADACLALVSALNAVETLLPRGVTPDQESVAEYYAPALEYADVYPAAVTEAATAWHAAMQDAIGLQPSELTAIVLRDDVTRGVDVAHAYGPVLCPGNWPDIHS